MSVGAYLFDLLTFLRDVLFLIVLVVLLLALLHPFSYQFGELIDDESEVY